MGPQKEKGREDNAVVTTDRRRSKSGGSFCKSVGGTGTLGILVVAEFPTAAQRSVRGDKIPATSTQHRQKCAVLRFKVTLSLV
jgi:hypothetical protein